MEKEDRIYVAGHNGLVGSAIVRCLLASGFTNIVTKTHMELDLTRQSEVEAFFFNEKIKYVFLAAAKVGGIWANSHYPAEFIYINTMIACNVIHSAFKSGVKNLINLGSSCIYPKHAPQPILESSLLSGPLEETNEAYAIAKIAALRMCKHYNQQFDTNYISVMPSNVYGIGDNYDLETSHVLPAIIRKMDEAKRKESPIVLWGDGSPFREFIFSDDLGDACVFIMRNIDHTVTGEAINVGSGEEVSIIELANIVKQVVQFDGLIKWDYTKPNGTPRKLMDSSKLLKLGWKPKVGLFEGVRRAYQDFLVRHN